MQSWLEGRIWVGKGAQATGMTASLRILSSKADSNHLWELHKEWTEAGVSASRVTMLRRLQEKGYQATSNQRQRQKHLPGLWRKITQWSKVFFSDESNFAFHLETRSQSLEEEWRGTESMLLEVQCEVSTVSDDLGCHVICWCWSTVFSEVHSQRSHLPGNFRALHASFCWQALWRCWFHFPAGLGTCPHCQRYQKLVQWPWCYCAWLASKLAWPEPHRESMGYCQEEDERHQTQQCRWAEGHCQRNLASIPPQQCHKLITSMPRRIEAVIKAKGAPTKYWVHITVNEHTFQKANNSLKMFFLLVLWSILICWDSELVGFC